MSIPLLDRATANRRHLGGFSRGSSPQAHIAQPNQSLHGTDELRMPCSASDTGQQRLEQVAPGDVAKSTAAMRLSR